MTSLNGSEEASDNSFQTYDDQLLNDEALKQSLSNSSLSNQLAWYKMPELSLSELAFRLKQAERRVFGKDKYLLNNGRAFNNHQKLEHDNEDGNTEDDVSINSDLLNRNACSEVYNAFDTSAQRTLMAINEKYKQSDDKHSEQTSLSFDNDMNIYTAFKQIKEEPMDRSSIETIPTKRNKKFGCGWCSYRTDSKAHLMRHSKSMHKNVEMKLIIDPTYIPPSKLPKDFKRKHQCDMCSYQTDCKSHLRRHKGSVHCKDKLYECPTCKIEFARSEQAKIHHLAYHPEKHFDIRNMHKPTPDVRKYKLTLDERMEKIKTLFDDVEQFTNVKQPSHKHQMDNSIIEREFDDSTDKLYSEHQPQPKKRIRVRDNNAFVCLKCDFSCRDMWHLKRHVIDVHSTQKDFNCKVCHYATSRAHRLYCHMLKHGELFCHVCEFSTINPEIYKLHSRQCTVTQKSLQCSLCLIDFTNTSVYKDHILSHHVDEMIECSKCSFITISEDDLTAHLLTHNWEANACKLCWHMANEGESLTDHLCDFHAKFDENNNTWVCSECDEKNEDKQKLARHIETHVCSVLNCPMELCQFKCSLQSSLDIHLKYIHRDNSDTNDVADNNDEVNDDDKLNISDDKHGETHYKDDSESYTPANKIFKSDDLYPDFKPPHDEVQVLPHVIVPSITPTSLQNPVTKEQFQGYACPRCPDRPPFRYKKSFEKHTMQHALDEQDESQVKKLDESVDVSG